MECVRWILLLTVAMMHSSSFYTSVDCAEGSSSHFVKKSDIDGKTCPTIPSWSNPAASVIQCISMCKHDASCLRTVFNSVNSLCLGYNSVVNVDDCVLGTGTETANEHYEKSCAQGYTLYHDAGTCYKVFDDNPTVRWSDARQICQDDGADLVIVKNSGFSDLLIEVSQSKGYLWIGASNEGGTGQWKWVDGSTADSSAWDFSGDCALIYFKISRNRCDVDQAKPVCGRPF